MPLYLEPPRPEAGHRNWTLRGEYLGQRVRRSTRSPDEKVARAVLKAEERAILARIKRGEPEQPRTELTFGEAASRYLANGGEARFLEPLDVIANVPVSQVTQELIDKTAADLYPNGKNATRNRQVHARISAVLKANGINTLIRRPADANGKSRTQWLWPDKADALLKAAAQVDQELGTLCVLLLYTGMRLSEALSLTCDMVRLDEATAYVPTTKNGEPRTVFLPPVVIAALASHPRGLERQGRVFWFEREKSLYRRLDKATAIAGVELAERTGFHIFRHTWGTWMRRYAGLDTQGLVATGAWKDKKSAARYAHSVTSEEAKRAALLPVGRPAGKVAV